MCPFFFFLFLFLFTAPPAICPAAGAVRLFNFFFFLLVSPALTFSATLPFPLGSPEDDENDDGGDSSKTSFPFYPNLFPCIDKMVV